MLGNTLLADLCNVSCHEVAWGIMEIGLVGSLRVDIPVAGKNTPATYGIEASPDTTYPCEKVYKSKAGAVKCGWIP